MSDPDPRGLLRKPNAVADLTRKRWAVLLGVSAYRARPLNLRYADKDIEELWKLLQTDRCGAFVEEQAYVRVNERATTGALLRGLRSFLHQASEEDLVFIYLAGHGARDPRTGVVYFLTHDTDPGDIAATAVPMREVMQSITENLRARRVILMMDTCHSAAVEGGRGADTRTPVELERYLSALASSTESFAIFTSSENDELSREDRRWGGGHGLFSHLILEGLRGAADRDGNGIVTLGELIDYVSAQVPVVGGGSAQHPRVGATRFDRDLVMAVTGGATARERLELGTQLLAMAREVGHRSRFEAAARYFTEAADAAMVERPLPEARLMAGVARFAAGDLAGADRALRRALVEGECPEADCYLAAVQAASGERAAAARAFTAFAEAHPSSAHAGSARIAARLLQRTPGAASSWRALLVGVGETATATLSGPPHDLASMRAALTMAPDAQVTDVTVLAEADATRDAIRDALQRLAGRSTRDDVILVYFSGSGSHGLEVHDGWLRADEVHDWVDSLPARRKLVILDTMADAALVERARRDGSYNLLVAAAPGEFVLDSNTGGVLTRALCRTLAQHGLRVPMATVLGELADAGADGPASRRSPIPLFIGNDRGELAAARHPTEDANLLLAAAIAGGQARSLPDALGGWYQAVLAELDHPFPDFHLAVGAALVRSGQLALAERALARGLAESRAGSFDGAWWSCLIHARRGEVEPLLARGADVVRAAPELGPWHVELERAVVAHRARRPRALVVGVDHVDGDEALTATDDASAFRDALASYGIPTEDVVFLADPTTAQIAATFEEVVASAAGQPVLFYYSGRGSDGEDGPALLGTDARRPGVDDLSLQRLSQMAAERDVNLASVIDTDLAPSVLGHERFVPGLGPRPKRPRDIGGPSDGGIGTAWSTRQRVGRATIYARPGRRITRALVDRLRASRPGELTWSGWVLAASAEATPVLVAVAADEPILADHGGKRALEAVVLHARRQAWQPALHRIAALVDQGRTQARLGLVDVGVGYLLVDALDGAERALTRAIAAAPDQDHPEASFFLGRVLLARGGDLARAQSELEHAARCWPDDPVVHYYLGAAVIAYFEQVSLEKARAAWTKYRDAGCPFGHRAEVETFLAGR